jgi:hypothetical protein
MRIILVFLCALVVASMSGIAGAETVQETREERLDVVILQQNLTFDDTQRASIKSKCPEAKQLLRNLRVDTETSIRKRLEIYNNMQKDLQALNLRFARQAVDASELDLLSGKLQQNLDEFTIESAAYGTAINDAIEVSCDTSPERFKAAVILTRTKYNLLGDKAAQIKDTLQSAKQYTYPQLKKRLTT